jgi:predicted ABC-type ATPase
MAMNVDSAFETTLSSKSYRPLIQRAKDSGYYVITIFFWLDSVDLAKKRVELRVKNGGHNIPANVIERRYHRGLENFFKLYQPISDVWVLYNNSTYKPSIIASKDKEGLLMVDPTVWEELSKRYG